MLKKHSRHIRKQHRPAVSNRNTVQTTCVILILVTILQSKETEGILIKYLNQLYPKCYSLQNQCKKLTLLHSLKSNVIIQSQHISIQTSHTSSAQQPHMAGSHHVPQSRYKLSRGLKKHYCAN